MITRVSGIIVVATVLAAVTAGILLAVRRGKAQMKGRTRLHRRLSWFALLLLMVHIGAALLDRNHVAPYALVAPFRSPIRRIAAGTGSLATWGIVVVTLTASGRRWLRPFWRKIHYVAYPACAFAVWHSLLGSDTHLIAFSLGLWSGALLVPVVPRVCGALRDGTNPVGLLALHRARGGLAPDGGDPSLVGVVPVPGHPAARAVPFPRTPPDLPHRPGQQEVTPAVCRAAQRVGPIGATTIPDDGLRAAAIEANPSLDDALARVRAHQQLLNDLCSAAPVVPATVALPSASEMARQLLLDRGLTIQPHVARQTAEHLLTPSPWGEERSAEFRWRRSGREEESVVITSTDLRKAIEAARSGLPHMRLQPLADVGTAIAGRFELDPRA
jgi:hypothetical protein